MKILCWNVNESVWLHWCNVLGEGADLTRSNSKEETLDLLATEQFDYCFVYLDDATFSRKVEDVVALKADFASVNVIAFPYLRSQSAGIRMLSAGVNAQCPPFVKKEQLALIMSVVDSGEIWGGKEFIQGLIEQSAKSVAEESWHQDELAELSERENLVAIFVSKGLSNKRIALEMNITERTVKAHLTTIYKKLAVKDRLALALLVQQHLKSTNDMGADSSNEVGVG